MSSALIRPARAADGDAIARVHVDTWRDAYAGILPTGYLVNRVRIGARQSLWKLGVPTSRARLDETLVAEVESVVGFVSFGNARHARGRIGEIYALYVQPDMQGQGLGRSLVEVALGRMFRAGFEQVDVEVLAANPSRHFYAALGAGIVGQGVHRFAGERLPVIYYRWQRPAET